MKLSDKGRELIVSFEGLSLTAYPDPATQGVPWTIGIGSTNPRVNPGDRITEQEAWHRFAVDIAPCERCVHAAVDRQMTQGQYDAFVSFVFNLGQDAFCNSTLLRLYNKGDLTGASNEFPKWVHGPDGNVIPGLVRRREAERQLYLEDEISK